MYINVFKRIEQKYILTKKEAEKVIDMMKDYVEEDEYFKSQINNIYFDDVNDNLIQNCIINPECKTKIRLRSYGVPHSMEDKVYLEIKSKYNNITGKRRIGLYLRDYYNYLETGQYDENNQIMREIDYFFKFFNLVPKLYIGYDRLSYRAANNKEFRITFDMNLVSRRYDLNLESGNYGEKYFSDDMVIMEIKTLDAIPIWFTKILTKCKLYPNSFSKYGKIYQNEQIKKLEEEKLYA